MTPPLGAEWGLVAVTEDLMAASRDLAELAYQFRRESHGWTHGQGRELLKVQAGQLVTWAQECALESTRGDYYTRADALRVAQGRVQAARHTLRRWWEAGELWNAHTIRPIPAIIRQEIEPWESMQ